MRRKNMIRLSVIPVLCTVLFSSGVCRVSAEEIHHAWDETNRVKTLRREVPTAITVYTKDASAGEVTHEEGVLDGVAYDILRARPSENTIVQVDYSETPVPLNQLRDEERIAQGYRYAGGVNAGYFSNSDEEYGKPVGAVRRSNEWTSWNWAANTPAYGNGFATAYINDGDLELKYHGWSWGMWLGDDSWQWWTGYTIDADYAVSGSFTYYADGIQQDITNGDHGGINYHTFGRAVTILAQKPDKQFLLITIYGTVAEDRITSFLGELGVSDAIRMDGGGSAQMVYETDCVQEVKPELAWTEGSVDTEPDEPAIGSVKVLVDRLRVRSAAGTSSSVRSTVMNGETYPVYETKDAEGYTWYRIGVSQWIAGQQGWTEYTASGESAAVSTPEPTPVPTVAPAQTPVPEVQSDPVIGTAEVLVDRLNIRQGPSTRTNRSGMTNTGKVYDVYETKEAEGYTWYRISSTQWIAGTDTWVKYTAK